MWIDSFLLIFPAPDTEPCEFLAPWSDQGQDQEAGHQVHSTHCTGGVSELEKIPYFFLNLPLYSITGLSQEVSLRLWDVEVTGLHCGPEAAAWLSRYLGGGCLLIQHTKVWD